MLGWNAGTEQELFTKEELAEKFSLERVHISGAKFDFEKAKWYNHEWIKKLTAEELLQDVKAIFIAKQIDIVDDEFLLKVISLVKDRCTLLTDFYEQGIFFFQSPSVLDKDAVLPKWNEDKKQFFIEFANELNTLSSFAALDIETSFKLLASTKGIKPGELQLPLRIMLVGGKYGPAVFEIASTIGKAETISRINKAISIFNA